MTPISHNKYFLCHNVISLNFYCQNSLSPIPRTEGPSANMKWITTREIFDFFLGIFFHFCFDFFSFILWNFDFLPLFFVFFNKFFHFLHEIFNFQFQVCDHYSCLKFHKKVLAFLTSWSAGIILISKLNLTLLRIECTRTTIVLKQNSSTMLCFIFEISTELRWVIELSECIFLIVADSIYIVRVL